ncbi:MAG: hypothetical protein ACOY3K_04665 [Candidatus Omnitrophota bacterium]
MSGPKTQIVFSVQSAGEQTFRARIEGPDFVGFLSVVTGLFASSGIGIENAHIRTIEGRAVDEFEVRSRETPDWQAFETGLRDSLGAAARGDHETVRRAIHAKLIQRIRSASGEFASKLFPIRLKIDQNASKEETVVHIRAQDTPAFLYELTNALSLLGINIARMEVRTIAGKVHDKLWLTYEGEKIVEDEKLKALQWAILFVKQFTHLLPKVPDPQAALEQFALLGKDLFQRRDWEDMLVTLKGEDVLQNLSRVLGASKFLWEEFIRTQYESVLPLLSDKTASAGRKVKKDFERELAEALAAQDSFEGKVDALNDLKDREMFRIDLRHLIGRASYVGEFTQEFTDLCEAVVDAAYRLARGEVLKTRDAPQASGGAESRAALMGLGKFGGRDLGYASDLELLFVYADDEAHFEQSTANLEFYSEVVRTFRRIIRAKVEGVFEIDLRLRPYGKDGPLACSLEAFRKYYEHAGDAWNFERQALIKLRRVGGDERLGRELETLRDAFVYSDQPFDFRETAKFRVRQQQELAKPLVVNAKFSPGGLLDVEYLVQMLQIAYGRRLGPSVRDPNTMKALRALWTTGVLSEKQFQDLRACYLFIRNLINALRMVRGNARDLDIPAEGTEEYITLARRLGFWGEDVQVSRQFKLVSKTYLDRAASLFDEWVEKLATADWPSLGEALVREPLRFNLNLDELLRGELSAGDRSKLEALGFRDLQAAVQRFGRLCPESPIFEYFARAIDSSWLVWKEVADPDMALEQFVWCAENAPDRQIFWYDLGREPRSMGLLLRLFGSSRYLSDGIVKNPANYRWIFEPDALCLEATRDLIGEAGSGEFSVEGLRELRHRETLRMVLAWMGGSCSWEELHEAFSDLADFILNRLCESLGLAQEIAVIALGKLGGRELNFSSDIDLMFLARPDADPGVLLPKIQELLHLLKKGGLYESLYRVDLRLRPHGDGGSLFLDLKDTLDYYERTAEPWELQAMIKARPAAGRKDLGEAFLQGVSPLLWRDGRPEVFYQRLREIKRRYESQTRRRGEETKNIKMGAGGIRDAEFAVQMIQLLHGHAVPGLRVKNTLAAVTEAQGAGFLSPAEAQVLRDAYLFSRQIEDHLHWYENRQIFNLPETRERFRSLARAMGFSGENTAEAFQGEFDQRAQACRALFEKIYFGGSSSS